MKKALYIALMLISIGCKRNTDTIIGTWKAEKVAVDFDEKHSTPEIVKQAGTLEKGNLIIISADSTLTFISQGDTIKGTISVKEPQILFNGKHFASLKDNQIVTNEATPFGNITVSYQKVR